jgi:hypothetical protein
MIAHAEFDLTAAALIYWNLEEPVAHLLFPQPLMSCYRSSNHVFCQRLSSAP